MTRGGLAYALSRPGVHLKMIKDFSLTAGNVIASLRFHENLPGGIDLPRYMEVALCGAGLLFLAPLLFVTALLIKLTSPGPVLYRQQRLGQHGRPFQLLKFRSMTHRADDLGPQVTAAGDSRITWLGRFLRRAKIDELPQLWNVVRGDMALVGPRPEVPCYVEHYPQLFELLLLQRPGITDVCTVHLRGEENLLARVGDAETFYIQTLLPRKLGASIREGGRRSFWRDVRVLVATVLPRLAFLAPAADFRPMADLLTIPTGAMKAAAPRAAAAAQGSQAAPQPVSFEDAVALDRVRLGT